MDLGLRNRSVFVAGSTRGIGFAIARAFLCEGAHVAVTGRDGECLDRSARALRDEASPERVLALQGDLTGEEEARRALEATKRDFGAVDVLVANIGSGSGPRGWDVERRDWEAMLNQNLLGSVQLARAGLPYLIPRQGNLIMISSIAGREAIGAPVAYSAAKAALESAVKSLSRLAGPEGVRVNAVVPGNVLFPGGTWEKKLAEKRRFYENYVRAEVPLQRFGKPEEIADAVVFLASERACFITGISLVVDGGQTRTFH